MSKFRVGQRVRIVGRDYFGTGTHPAGLEAVITDGPGTFLGPRTGRSYTWIIRTVDGRQLWVDSHDIEPATDSYDVVSWKDCVWQPEHLRAEA